MKQIKKLLILALAVISGTVFALQVKAETWALISLYWLVLTVKNTLDVWGEFETK